MGYKTVGWILQITGAIPFILVLVLFIGNIPEATTGGSWGVEFDWKLLVIGFVIFIIGFLLIERGNRAKSREK